MPGSTGDRVSFPWPTDTPKHRARIERQWYVDREDVEDAKTALLSPAERSAFLFQLGKAIEPWLDAKLEAKARELIETRQIDRLAAWADIIGSTGTSRNDFLCSREGAAQMLGITLDALTSLETDGTLPRPIKIQRRPAHRVVDIERIARSSRKGTPSDQE